MGIVNFADTKYCIRLRLHRQSNIGASLGGGGGHGESVSRAQWKTITLANSLVTKQRLWKL